jgi:hypothetical protein
MSERRDAEDGTRDSLRVSDPTAPANRYRRWLVSKCPTCSHIGYFWTTRDSAVVKCPKEHQWLAVSS